LGSVNAPRRRGRGRMPIAARERVAPADGRSRDRLRRTHVQLALGRREVCDCAMDRDFFLQIRPFVELAVELAIVVALLSQPWFSFGSFVIGFVLACFLIRRRASA